MPSRKYALFSSIRGTLTKTDYVLTPQRKHQHILRRSHVGYIHCWQCTEINDQPVNS